MDASQQSNAVRIFQLKKDLITLTQGDLTVTEYFSQLGAIWHKLSALTSSRTCTCGSSDLSTYLDKELVLMFLIGLNDNYQKVRDNILSMNYLPDIFNAVYMVREEERKRQVANSSPPFKAKYDRDAAKNTKKDRPPSTGSQLAGPSKANTDRGAAKSTKKDKPPSIDSQLAGPSKANADRDAAKNTKKYRPVCSYCGILGHTHDRCYKLHGYPIAPKPGGTRKRSRPINRHQIAVKKRQKQLQIIRPIPVYGGEASGIDPNLIRSIKLT